MQWNLDQYLDRASAFKTFLDGQEEQAVTPGGVVSGEMNSMAIVSKHGFHLGGEFELKESIWVVIWRCKRDLWYSGVGMPGYNVPRNGDLVPAEVVGDTRAR
eukprot:1043166-Rhodomonas_salina.2